MAYVLFVSMRLENMEYLKPFSDVICSIVLWPKCSKGAEKSDHNDLSHTIAWPFHLCFPNDTPYPCVFFYISHTFQRKLGPHFLPPQLGPKASLVDTFGDCSTAQWFRHFESGLQFSNKTASRPTI